MTTPDWRTALPVPPAGGELQAAWCTSFDEPDAALLVEHLLPSLLSVSGEPAGEPADRTAFLGALEAGLERLRQRITVISSPPRNVQAPVTYPWLWRYVDSFHVGAKDPSGRLQQHAKLWAFHWRCGEEEFLELHVSSTNLTMSAFRSQLQAGWRTLLPLAAKPSALAAGSWGQLVVFLRSLGDSAGSIARGRIETLLALLDRATCPEGVTFVASVPGGRAARQLAGTSAIHVLAPTIGNWNATSLAAWAEDAGIDPKRIHLKWIDADHPWAQGQGWTLSSSACAALQQAGVRVQRMDPACRLAEQHELADERWSHAKLYLLKRGRKWSLLVTSANWSASAWGAGRRNACNFELGVMFETGWRDLQTIGQSFDPPRVAPFCRDEVAEENPEANLRWGEAEWNGTVIASSVRSADEDEAISFTLSFSDGSTVRLPQGQLEMAWSDPNATPIHARFEQAGEVLIVSILDTRSPEAFRQTPLSGIDPALSDGSRVAWLLERYGGPAVELDPGTRQPVRAGAGSEPAAGDYAVRAWIDSRQAFGVVGKWHEALSLAGLGQTREQVLLDGQTLRDFYAQHGTPAGTLAAEELAWRLEGTN